MLAPGMKSMGRDRYFGFWSTIESVDVRDVRALSGGDTLEVTLVYRTTDGKTSTERKREDLSVTDDGELPDRVRRPCHLGVPPTVDRGGGGSAE